MRLRQPWFDLHDDSLDSPDVAIIGLPYDGSTSLKAGAALGPEKLRDISKTSDPVTRRGRLIEGLSVRDFGDISYDASTTQREYLDTATSRLTDLPDSSFVLTLGGDNSVSIAAINAFARRHDGDVGVIWFDAHPDLFEEYDGNPDSHACALHRAMELADIPPAHAVLLGTRSFSRGEVDYAREKKIEIVTAADWAGSDEKTVVDRICARLKDVCAVYLAIDIDGFDSSHSPGTGYPMPGGVNSESFFTFMELLFQRLPVRGIDVTEIAPPLDTNDVTGFLGVQVILETFGILAGQHSR